MNKLPFLSVAFMVALSPVYGADTTQTTESMKRTVKQQIEQINTPKQIQIPKFLGSDYGALATNTLPVVVNGFSIVYTHNPPADIQQILSKNLPAQVGKTMLIKDIIAILEKSEQQIIQAGYPFVKVILPVQDIIETGADIQVKLVSGVVENIDVDVANKQDIPAKTTANITTLIKNAIGTLRTYTYLRSEDLNEVLLTLREYYGLSSQLFINPGSQLGSFNLNISTAFNKSNSIFTVKNNLGPSFGNYGGTLIHVQNSIQEKSTSQFNIVALLSLTQKQDAYYRMLQAGYTRKFLHGQEFGITGAVSRTASVTESDYQLDGVSDSLGVSYKLPMTLTFETVSNITLGYDYGKSSSYNVNSEKFQNADVTSVVSLAYDIRRERNGRSHALNIKLNKNHGWLGAKATTVDGIDSSRQGATVHANFANVNYEFSSKVANRFRYILTLDAQYSGGASLLNGQKFSLMGDGQVRGFVGDSVTGDSGAVINNALIFKPVTLQTLTVSPAIDIAYGEAHLYTYTATESPKPKASSATLSLSTTIRGSRLELGAGIANKKGLKDQKDRFWNFGITVPLR